MPAGNDKVGVDTFTMTNGSPADSVKVGIQKSKVAPAAKLFDRIRVIK